MQPTDELEKLAPLHPRVETRVLVKVAEPATELRIVKLDLDPGDGRAAGGGSGKPGQDPNRRCLAGAVRTKQAKDRAGRHDEVEPV